MVQASLDHYNAAYGRCKTWKDAREHGVSHAHNRVSWLAALDWVWNDLEPGTRDSLASGMINSVQKHLELFPDVRYWRGSYYSAESLYWYSRVALVSGDRGEDDYQKALNLLKEGYGDHLKMLEHRGNSRLDDGGLRPRIEYSLPAYPHAEWKFFHSWRAAISPDIPGAWLHTALLPNHAYWNLLPDLQHFGLGQAWHNPAYMRPRRWVRALGGYLAQHIHFFEASHPEMTNLSRCLWEKMDYLRAGKYGSIPFWSEIWSPVDNAQRARLPEDLPLARHIRILDARDVLVDRELTQQIMPQAGLALTR